MSLFTPTIPPPPPGLNQYGITFGLPHSNGLTLTVPWFLVGIVGVAGYYFAKRF